MLGEVWDTGEVFWKNQGGRKERRKEMACNLETENLIEATMLVFCFHVIVIPWMGLQNKRLYHTMSVVERCWNQWWQRLSPYPCACISTRAHTYKTKHKHVHAQLHKVVRQPQINLPLATLLLLCLLHYFILILILNTSFLYVFYPLQSCLTFFPHLHLCLALLFFFFSFFFLMETHSAYQSFACVIESIYLCFICMCSWWKLPPYSAQGA